MRRNAGGFAIGSLEGGMDGTTPPHALPEQQCVQATNVDWDGATLARKRNGCESVSTSNINTASSSLAWLYRHVPGGDDTAAEVWAWSASGTVLWRCAAGATFASIALADTLSAAAVCGASYNGKLFVAYDSNQDRLHVWDGSSVRRVGLAAPSAAPTSSTSGGAATDTRKYRSVVLHISGSDTIRRSEPSTASGTVTLATQRSTETFAGAPGEGETHWELQAASDDDNYATWWVVGQATTATTIVDNNASLTTLEPAPEEGLYKTLPSGRYLLIDENRMLVAGSFESTSATLTSRVYFTPVLGSSDIGDDERYINTSDLKGWVDLDRGFGGPITGMGLVFGTVFVFKRKAIYRLTRTFDPTTPYAVKVETRALGCLAHRTIRVGEDEGGNPCLYFLSERGPYRLGVNGLEYLGKAIEHITKTLTESPVEHASNWTCYYPERHQVWWWWATAAGTTSNALLVYDVKRRAWSQFTGMIVSAAHGDLLPTTFGATMARTLKPGLGMLFSALGVANLLYRADVGTDDAGTAFQAFVTSRVYTLSDTIGAMTGVSTAFVRAAAAAGVTIQLTLTRDFGVESRTSTASIAATASETRVTREFDAARLTGAQATQFTLGDASAVSNNWKLDALALRVPQEENQ